MKKLNRFFCVLLGIAFSISFIPYFKVIAAKNENYSHIFSEDNGMAHYMKSSKHIIGDKTDSWTASIFNLYKINSPLPRNVYCCDFDTVIDNNTKYIVKNLEDSDYYTPENAKHIRAIVTSSYPFVSIEEMIKNMTDYGVTDKAQNWNKFKEDEAISVT